MGAGAGDDEPPRARALVKAEDDGGVPLREGWRARLPRGPPAARAWRELGAFPTTSLMALVRWGVYGPPWLRWRPSGAPDIFHAGRAFYGIEYELGALPLPPAGHFADGGARAWLMLDGTNYTARVFVNGRAAHAAAAPRRVYEGGELRWRRAAAEGRGMWTARALDVTPLLDFEGANSVRIEVDAADHVGCVDGGGQGGDHRVAQDVTAQFVEGWDWMCPIADRNTGVWDDVRLLVCGPVRLQDLHVVSAVPPDPPRGRAVDVRASIAVTVVNPGAEARRVALEASVEREVDGDGWVDLCAPPVEAAVWVDAGSARTVRLPEVCFRTADLWWPVGLGAQPLFRASVRASVAGGGAGGAGSPEASHAVSALFGVRSLTSAVDPATGGRVFRVNGRRVFVRGANWTCSDGWLRLSQERWAAEVAMLARAGVNMLRLWGGSNLARPGLLHECDRRGVMVWFEFWITGDCDGRGGGAGRADWPLDHRLFLENALGMAVWARNHPSVAIWCGGNEQRPCAEIDAALRRHLDGRGALTDGGDDRAYVSGSLWEGFGSGNGALNDGPYGIQRPEDFFPAPACPVGQSHPKERAGGAEPAGREAAEGGATRGCRGGGAPPARSLG